MRKPHKLFREIYGREMSPLARKVLLKDAHRYLKMLRELMRLMRIRELSRRKCLREGKVWQ